MYPPLSDLSYKRSGIVSEIRRRHLDDPQDSCSRWYSGRRASPGESLFPIRALIVFRLEFESMRRSVALAMELKARMIFPQPLFASIFGMQTGASTGTASDRFSSLLRSGICTLVPEACFSLLNLVDIRNLSMAFSTNVHIDLVGGDRFWRRFLMRNYCHECVHQNRGRE